MTLDDAWLRDAVERTAGRPPNGLHGTASLSIGDESLASLEISDGRVVGAWDGEPAAVVPLTPTQAGALAEGDLDVAVAYMRGDLKPVGSTAAILAVVDVLEALRQHGHR